MTPIDVLPDDVLLMIFDLYMVGNFPRKWKAEAWRSLVHVCRRWRCVVFGSPRRLNLQLVCTNETPVRERLDVWPALPLIVKGAIFPTSSIDNIVVALGHSDRVCRIDLHGVTEGLQWDQVLAAMQVSFPALTDLLLRCPRGETLVIPDTFLGGSAPLLEYFNLNRIPFPGMPNLLLSATHLVGLHLSDIPHSGYISPEVMASCLSASTSLKSLSLSFSAEFLHSRSRQRPPKTPFILPCLTMFWFRGASVYLDDLVARIDAPRLDHLSITFRFGQMNFDTPHLEILDTPHLVQFISRTPRFKEPNEAHVTLDLDAKVELFWASNVSPRHRAEISYDDPAADPHPSFIAQVYTMCLPPLPTVENLRLGRFAEYLDTDLYYWKDDVENDHWLELLGPFTAVKNLYLSEEFQPDIASALQELVGDRTTEVLPSLQNIFVAKFEPSGPFGESIGRFVAARQLSGHPVAVLPL
jgi:hypothetical protein